MAQPDRTQGRDRDTRGGRAAVGGHLLGGDPTQVADATQRYAPQSGGFGPQQGPQPGPQPGGYGQQPTSPAAVAPQPAASRPVHPISPTPFDSSVPTSGASGPTLPQPGHSGQPGRPGGGPA